MGTGVITVVMLLASRRGTSTPVLLHTSQGPSGHSQVLSPSFHCNSSCATHRPCPLCPSPPPAQRGPCTSAPHVPTCTVPSVPRPLTCSMRSLHLSSSGSSPSSSPDMARCTLRCSMSALSSLMRSLLSFTTCNHDSRTTGRNVYERSTAAVKADNTLAVQIGSNIQLDLHLHKGVSPLCEQRLCHCFMVFPLPRTVWQVRFLVDRVSPGPVRQRCPSPHLAHALGGFVLLLQQQLVLLYHLHSRRVAAVSRNTTNVRSLTASCCQCHCLHAATGLTSSTSRLRRAHQHNSSARSRCQSCNKLHICANIVPSRRHKSLCFFSPAPATLWTAASPRSGGSSCGTAQTPCCGLPARSRSSTQQRHPHRLHPLPLDPLLTLLLASPLPR